MHGKQADVSEWLNANKSLYSDLSRAARHHRKLAESHFAALLPTHVLATEEEVQEIAVFLEVFELHAQGMSESYDGRDVGGMEATAGE